MISKSDLETAKYNLRRIKTMAALLQNSELVKDWLVNASWLVDRIRLIACATNDILEQKVSTCKPSCEPMCWKPVEMVKVPVPPEVCTPKKVTTASGKIEDDDVDMLINKFGSEELKNEYYKMKKRWDDICIEISVKGFKK